MATSPAAPMKKARPSKKLEELPKPYHTSVMTEIAQQTDRGAAIIGGAYLDIVLREAITAQLLDMPDIVNQLFENRGVLQDFGAQMQIALVLGIFGRRAYDDLRIVKDIRNMFAHAAEAMDFSYPPIVDRCKNLWFATKIVYGKRLKPTTSRELYIRTIELMTDGFHDSASRRNTNLPPSNFLMMGPK